MMELERILPNDYLINTHGDLKLIDILYQQDVDLGVGKEVFDPSMREELERKRELEFVKQQEKQRAHSLAEEKKEREKQELKDNWLKKNFRRDGETGEWVQLQNGIVENIGNHALPLGLDSCENDQEHFTLEDALDFLGNLQRAQDGVNADSYFDDEYGLVQELPEQQFDARPEEEQLLEQPVLEHQDNFDDNWNGLMDYLNMTINGGDSVSSSNSTHLQLSDKVSTHVSMSSVDFGLEQDVDLQKDCLNQNVTLQSPVVDITTNCMTHAKPVTSVEELDSSVSPRPAISMMDFYLNDLGFFSNLTTMQNESTEGFPLEEVNHLLVNAEDLHRETLIDNTLNLSDDMDSIQVLEDSLNVPAASNESTFPYHDFGEPFDALEGATGGIDYGSNYGDMSEPLSKVSHLSESSNDSGYVNQGAFSSSPSSTSSSYAGSPAGSHGGINSSNSGNDTENDLHGTRIVTHPFVAHNHTYNTQPDEVTREVKKYSQKEPSRKGPHSRDQRRAEELKIPFVIEDIIESPVETFNEMLTKYKLNEVQLALIRDIRRRGKNKVAAQNCRKRKVGVIFSLADEMSELQKMRDRLVAERAAMDRERRKMKEKFGHLYTHIFQSLRDDHGEPYDPSLYSLQQSSDGNVFLVPRNLTINKNSNSSSPSSNDSTGSKKRKSFDY